MHHVIACRVLDAAGVNFRSNLHSSNPVLFFIGWWLARPVSWFCGDMLVYRLKFKIYMIVQPVLLLLSWGAERDACATSAAEYPELTNGAFGAVAVFLRRILHSSVQGTLEDGPLATCCKVHAWLAIMIALVLPGAVIYYLEQQAWWEFTRADPTRLSWTGGPSRDEIRVVQRKLRLARKQSDDYYYHSGQWDGRTVAIGFVVTAVLWQLLDATFPNVSLSSL